MPRGKPKSEHNPCPVCGLPRGKGPHEFAHGKCAEQRAKDLDASDKVTKAGDLKRITIAHKKRAIDNATKKKYRTGKLPDWMFS